MIDVLEKVEEFPPSFGTTYGRWKSKYQYFPAVEEVTTEFGRIQCDYGFYVRHCLRLQDDGGGPDNYAGAKARKAVVRAFQQEN